MSSLYFKQIVAKPISIIWLLLTGGASFASYIGIGDEQTSFVRFLGVLTVFMTFLSIGLLASGYQFFRNSFDPIKIRKVIKGTHYYKDNILIILDKSVWVKEDQILTLFTNHEEIKTPFCLVRVETFTTANYPQCAVLRTLSPENIPEFLLDSSRWSNIFAYPEVKSQYIEGGL